jgi:hypothetical protein
MSSRRYISYKFLYDDDLGNTSIKRHRSYLASDGLSEETPTTGLFLARVVVFDEKVTGTSKGLRHVLSYVGSRQLKAKIPYAPGNSQLIDHIEEILAVERVACGDYYGEVNIRGGHGF